MSSPSERERLEMRLAELDCVRAAQISCSAIPWAAPSGKEERAAKAKMNFTQGTCPAMAASDKALCPAALRANKRLHGASS